MSKKGFPSKRSTGISPPSSVSRRALIECSEQRLGDGRSNQTQHHRSTQSGACVCVCVCAAPHTHPRLNTTTSGPNRRQRVFLVSGCSGRWEGGFCVWTMDNELAVSGRQLCDWWKTFKSTLTRLLFRVFACILFFNFLLWATWGECHVHFISGCYNISHLTIYFKQRPGDNGESAVHENTL